MVRLFVLGAPRVEIDGLTVGFDRRKSLALLVYLAVDRSAHNRDALATLFWPDSDQTRARAALRQALSTLVSTIGDAVLSIDRELVQIRDEAPLWVDAHALKMRVRAPAERANDASLTHELYRGDFCTGFSLTDAPEFDRWQTLQSEALRQDYGAACAHAIASAEAAQHMDQALGIAKQWVLHDALNEEAQRALIRGLARNGQRSAALRQYEACTALLLREFGVPPSADTTALAAQITAARNIPSVPEDPDLPAPREPAPHNLPAQVTTFVGRVQELADIRKLLLDDADCRLLTLVGTGGVGKTRLALQAAQQCLGAFANGVFFVSLAELDSPSYLAENIASAIGFAFYNQSNPRRQLLSYLREKKMLLVLDNFEHLLPAAAFVAEVLANAPHVKVLVTCRERLHLQAEWLLDVSGLEVPLIEPKTDQDRAQSIEAFSALKLFVQRARQVQPRFNIAQDLSHVVRIAQLTGGVPLALEMAAAWSRVLKPAQIADQIAHNLNFLSSSLADTPERHRSMRAIFEQSWEHLTEIEQRTLAKLSVFRGGWTSDAAARVADAKVSLLAMLADRALIRNRPDARFEMHELLRQFAHEKAVAGNIEAEANAAHLAWVLDETAHHTNGLNGPREQQALLQLGHEMENLRVAWSRALLPLKLDALARLALPLQTLLFRRTRYGEAQALMADAVQAIDDIDTNPNPGLTRALAGKGYANYRLGDYAQAEAALDRALDSARQQRLQRDEAIVQNYRGLLRRARGDTQGAQNDQMQAVNVARNTGDITLLATALKDFGAALYTNGAHDLAATCFAESQQLARQSHDQWTLAGTLNGFGVLRKMQGRYDDARLLHLESLAIWQEMGATGMMAQVLNNLGNVSAHIRRFDEAREYFERALKLHQDMGYRIGVAQCLNNMGNACMLGKDFAGAREALEASLAIHQSIGSRAELAVVHANLGFVETQAGNLSVAAERLSLSLRLSMETNSMLALPGALLYAAHWLIATAEREKALSLYAWVYDLNASTQDIKQEALDTLIRIGETLTTARKQSLLDATLPHTAIMARALAWLTPQNG